MEKVETATPITPTWRQLSTSDVGSLVQVADQIHSDLPESQEVFAERVKLFPEGCLALVSDGKLHGYAISHPIRRRQPPALDSLLGELAPDADQYYIHDIAILPEARGSGSARECVERLLDLAQRYPSTSLVSVYGTAPFWSRFGFRSVEIDKELIEKLQSYGDANFMERKNDTI